MRSKNEGVAHEDSLTSRLTVETYQPPVPQPSRSAAMPWWLAAIGAGVVAAIAGWALVAALVLIAQLAQTGIILGSALQLSTQMWLLGQGGILALDGLRITLVPLGFTAILALILHGLAGYAARQAILADGEDAKPGVAVMKVTAVVAASYTILVTLASFLVDSGDLRAASGGLGLSLVMGFLGARKAVKWNPAQFWPVWAQAVPRAIGAGVLTALAGGVIVLLAGLIAHRAQIIAMTDQLNPGWAGGVVLALLQLFYVLTLVVWCVSWSFGPGFTLGDGSVVSLMGSQVGLLPAFPVTAALPGGDFSWLDLFWLVIPIAAGAAAAVVILRARPRARFDETALVGGLSGALAGVAVTAMAFCTQGSLGMDRLAGMGPFILPLLVISCSIMGIGGMLTGLVAGLVRRPHQPADPLWWSRWGNQPDVEAHADAVPRLIPEPSTPASKARPFGWLTPVLKKTPKPEEPTEQITQPTQILGDSQKTKKVGRTKPDHDEQPPLDFHAADR